MIRVADLFAGAGGMSTGLMEACLGVTDVDLVAVKTREEFSKAAEKRNEELRTSPEAAKVKTPVNFVN